MPRHRRQHYRPTNKATSNEQILNRRKSRDCANKNEQIQTWCECDYREMAHLKSVQ